MRPKVSVCVVTFNQASYIRQCLQSIVDQETDFPFEVIVGDDASTDGTREIVQEFAERFPGQVRPILQPTNAGAFKNYEDVHRAAIGEYIAHIDGDDYALPGKLSAQVAVLDSRPEVSMSVHAVTVEGCQRLIGADASLPELCALPELVRRGTYFVNSSTMYRSTNAFEHDPGLEIVDFYQHIEHASKGNIHLTKVPLGVYRWHSEGLSKSVKHRRRIEQAYALAYDRAQTLGVSFETVNRARIARRKSFALARLADGDVDGFKEAIALRAHEIRYADAKHIFLASFKSALSGRIGSNILRTYLSR